MTTQDLGPDRSLGTTPVDELPGALGTLFDSSPAQRVRTSAAAETAFVLGLFAVLAVPFPLALALCLGLAGVALLTSIVGLARASRSGFAGGILASVGLVLALVTLALIGLRYLGVDTAFGPDLAPTLLDWLADLNTLVRQP